MQNIGHLTWTNIDLVLCHFMLSPVASFTKEVNPRLAKRPLKINGRLANHELTSLVKEATGSNGLTAA